MDELAEYLNSLNVSEDFKRGFMEGVGQAEDGLTTELMQCKCLNSIYDALSHFNDDHDVVWLAWCIIFINLLAGFFDYTQDDVKEAMKHVEESVGHLSKDDIIRRYK